MEKIREEIDEQVFHAWANGFTQGQISAIKMVEDLGLINYAMADMLKRFVDEGVFVMNNHFPKEEQRKVCDAVTENILKI